MLRGWILGVACTLGLTSTVQAQYGRTPQRQHAPQGFLLQGDVQQHVPRGDVELAAAANDVARRPASARERSTQPQQPSRTNNGSLASRFKFPNLLPKMLRGNESAHQQQVDAEAPMPYDTAEAGSQPPRQMNRAVRPPANRQAVRQPQPPNRRPTQQQSRAATRQSPNRNMPLGVPTAPKVARQSPAPSARRNELAEALAGLGTSEEELAAERSESEPIREAAIDEMAPPTADDDEQLPSYLTERNSAPSASSSAPRRGAVRSLDVGSALLGDAVDVRDPPSRPAADTDATLGSLPAENQPAARPAARPRPAVATTKSATRNAPARSTATVPSRPASAEDFAAVLGPKAPASSSPRVASTPRVEATPAETAEPTPVEDSIGDIAADDPNPSVDRSPIAADDSKTVAAPSRAAALPAIGVRPQRDVLYSARQPVILSNIEGPQRIVVGRPAAYRVTLENKGDVSARTMTAVITAPAGAEIADAAATNGEVQLTPADPSASKEIKWQLYELAAGASQTLTLQIVPRSGREMQLGVQWSHAPVTGQAIVEVQEPKLAMEIAGPGDVLFGKSQRYSLTLANPGNGSAEEVVIELTPPGGNADSMVRHKVGTLAPGESKKIELELTAREAGELVIKAAATATGDLRTESTKTVLCRKAQLEIDYRGPDKKFAGAVATYFLRVRNPGTASADDVAVEVNLPAGAELVKASEGHEWDADRRAVTWKSGSIPAGEERFVQIDCKLSHPGVNNMELIAQTAKGDLSDVKKVPITVEALADLKLEVSDPQGVVPVGEMAVYEIRIQNRGAIAARGVEVVAMFSEGIEPSHVEGAQHTIRDGRVAFRPIDELAAGGETVLRIHAKASASGTHVFRAEVSCQELEAKLAAEETTRFFTEEERWADASTAYADEPGTTTR